MDSNLPPDNTPPPQYNPPPPTPPSFTRPPPVITPSAVPRPARRGTGWMIFAIILLVLLGLSMLLNLRSAVRGITSGRTASYHSYGPRLEEVTIKDSSSYDKIAVIPVEGIISGSPIDQGGYSMVSLVKEQLRRARQDRYVKAVILKVNSPGGEVLASDDIANAIEDFETNSAKPVVVSMGSLAASGGYYVSVKSDWIVANELTITGSIGVIIHGFNYRGLLDKVGVKPEVFKSGKFKDMLSGTREPDEITPEERQMVQNLIDETYGKFKSVVADGRQSSYSQHHGRKLTADWADYADGRILSGKQALKLGFVDELGDFQVAVRRAERLAGVPRAELIQYQPVFDLSNIFRLLGKSDAKSVKLDLGADIPKLEPGCQYFLSPTFLH